MRIIVAPDSFKGSADAREAASAIAAGWSSARPGDELVLLPMADGGEGTLDAFEAAVPGSVRREVRVTGPLGDPVDASWLLLPDGTAVVELASTSGITLLDPDRLRAQDATTRGFGEAVADALAAGATRLLLAIGSSCSTDGGAGALQALGAELLTADGRPVGPGARGLAEIASVDLAGLAALPPRGAVVVSDVVNPLLGQLGAAAVFGPQKGATPDDMAAMETALARFAALVPGSAETPGAGAAGGTGFGLLAWGASLAPGAAVVAETVRLGDALRGADAVVTGEGRFDAQSAAGKVPSFVVAAARAASVPALLVAGSIESPTDDFAAAVSLTELAGSSAAAIAAPLPHLERAGALLAATLAGARS
ncbi:glycerate kinase [Frondihabitans peucedani]|uniref:Glycerate kinase n=1 Tax=Frondihabitans peucedani TaxID=598626 RepID=A0ABP8E2N7_9MICO